MPKLFSRVFKRLSFATDRHLQPSWSQEGEDRLIDKLLEHKPRGFYVDVGAHHPRKFSNTHLLHLNGWTGINIDANPASIQLFNQTRPHDKNICALISNETKSQIFYEFDHAAVSTCDSTLANQRIEQGYFKLKSKRTIESRRLCDILQEFLPGPSHVNLLSIDVEGHDLEVLQSNDWKLCRPEWILVECAGGESDNPLDVSILNILESDVSKFLSTRGYDLFSRLARTCFFKLQSG